VTNKERKTLNRLQQRLREGEASPDEIRQLILLKRKRRAK